MYSITDTNLHIFSSYEYSKNIMYQELYRIQAACPTSSVWRRSMESLANEWMVHNALYRLHLLRSHTADVDLNYPQRYDWLYTLLAPLAEVLIK